MQTRGYYVASGTCQLGTDVAGGLGRLLAQWVSGGAAAVDADLSAIDVARFLDVHGNSYYLHLRAPEVASE